MKKMLTILRMVPVVIEIVQTIEAALPESGRGKEKLALVRDILSEVYEGLGDIWPKLEKVVELFVRFANSVGLFHKKQQEKPVTTGG